MILSYIVAHSDGLFLPTITVAALLDSINPCAFSILFLTITFLLSLGKNRRFIVLSGASYIFGIALVYTLIGVGTLKVLTVLNVPNVMAKVGASILVIYSLIGIINEYFPSFPIKLKISAGTHATIAKIIQRSSVPASLGLGILVGLFEFPCTGGPYLFVLSLLHDHTKFWEGLAYLIYYNIMFVLPLIIVLAIAVNKTMLDKIDRLRRMESKKYRIALLLVLAFVGVIVFFL